jgi:hypothetical protein
MQVGLIESNLIWIDSLSSDKDTEREIKFYREAKEKFAECVNTWNSLPLEFTIHLGFGSVLRL